MADLVKGDTDVKFVFILVRKNGNPHNLTNKTVNLKYRIGSTVYATKVMTIVDATLGKVEYKFLVTELGNAGRMYVEVEIIGATGLVVSSGTVGEFDVRDKVKE